MRTQTKISRWFDRIPQPKDYEKIVKRNENKEGFSRKTASKEGDNKRGDNEKEKD